LDPDNLSASSLSGKRSDQRFLRLLSLIPFQNEEEPRPPIDLFEWADLDVAISRCEVKHKANKLKFTLLADKIRDREHDCTLKCRWLNI